MRSNGITANGIYQADLYEFLTEVLASVNALKADVTEVRAKLITTQTQLDADAGVSGTTYVSANAPAAITAATLSLS